MQPHFLEQNIAKLLLEKACLLCPKHGTIFENCGLRISRAQEQILLAADIASANHFSSEEMSKRLVRAWNDEEDEDRISMLSALSCCATKLREATIHSGNLDRSTQNFLFGQLIENVPDFWQDFDAIVVDCAEESSALALEFYRLADEQQKSVFLAYLIGGGYQLESIPTLVAEFIARRTDFRYLDATGISLAGFGEILARKLSLDFKNPLATPDLIDQKPPTHLQGQSQTEMAERMAVQIAEILSQGVAIEKIVVITPRPDPSLALVLKVRLAKAVYFVEEALPLVKYPLVRALLCALELAHPAWNCFPSFAEVQVMLSVLLDIDPVRAELLTTDVLDPLSRTLRPGQATRFPERVGFANLASYQQLHGWLETYQAGDQRTIPDFWEHLVAELCNESFTPEDVLLFQALIATTQEVQNIFPGQSQKSFLKTLRSGLYAPQLPIPSEPFLLLATPEDFLAQDLQVHHQFWFDISSDHWLKSAWQTLYNHRVLTPEWNGQPFGELQDRRFRMLSLAKLLFQLSCRTETLWFVQSSLNARGEENTGLLAPIILSAIAESYS
ncbi:MAG: hypothetical protein H7Y37_18900 [Anaerolineae bacterium]|nr:hypothetical protein [Gloeobacterales cyanobacterium ES-bin-313]